jgi:exosortase/archaeosortase family protein
MLQRIRILWQDKAVSFVLRLLAVYMLWKLFHHFAHSTAWWHAFTDQQGHFIAIVTAQINTWLGLATQVDRYYLLLPLNRYIGIEDHCLAIPAMVVLGGTLLLLPGRWRDKAWFIPTSVGILLLVNLTRFIILSFLLVYTWYSFWEFVHSWVYVVVFYGIDMLLFMRWIDRYAYPRDTSSDSV